MRVRSRRSSSPVLVIAVAVALTTAWGGAVALAAEEEPGEPSPEPEPGLAWDASLVVTFLDGDGAPIGGAAVTLLAERPGAEGETTSFDKAAGTTEADGTATFADLPRATDEAGAGVSWWVEALASDAADVDGCAYGRILRGTTTIEDPLAGEQTVTITAEATEPEWGACEEPGEGAPVVTVVALGLPEDGTDGGGPSPAPVPSDDPTATAEPGTGTGDGDADGSTDPAAQLAPAAVSVGWVGATQTRADGATWSTGEVELVDGVAEVRVQAWGVAPATSTLVIRVQGPYLRSEIEGDCTVDIVLAGETTVEASFATDPPRQVEVELAETRVEAGCGGSTPPPVDATDGEGAGAGGPDNGGGGSELPATDTAATAAQPAATAPGGTVGDAPALAIALGLGWLVAAGIGLARVVRRRTARA
jgi:hypothetical protein